MSEMSARCFNKQGLKKAVEFLNAKEEPQLAVNWIHDEDYSFKIEDLELKLDTEFKFRDKFELGKYLVESFGDLSKKDIYSEVGFWTWICFLYLDQLVKRKNGNPVYFKYWNYILTPKGQRSSLQYRHRIFAWYYLYLKFNEKSRFFLSTEEPYAQGDTIEQILSTNWALTQHFDLFYDLYFDEELGRAKSGVLIHLPDKKSKKKKNGKYNASGKVRRLLKELKQIDTVYITHKLSDDKLKEVIGDEFKEFFGQ